MIPNLELTIVVWLQYFGKVTSKTPVPPITLVNVIKKSLYKICENTIFTNHILRYKDTIVDSILMRKNTANENPYSRIVYAVHNPLVSHDFCGC